MTRMTREKQEKFEKTSGKKKKKKTFFPVDLKKFFKTWNHASSRHHATPTRNTWERDFEPAWVMGLAGPGSVWFRI